MLTNFSRFQSQATHIGRKMPCKSLYFLFSVQKPASAYDVEIKESVYASLVLWKLPNVTTSSYITRVIIHLNRETFQNISRTTQFRITGLIPNTLYTVEIQLEDSSTQKSRKVFKRFRTKEAGNIQ